VKDNQIAPKVYILLPRHEHAHFPDYAALFTHILNMDRLPFMTPVEEVEEGAGLVAARAA
jgi:hypothetical protein